ncbi:ferredoxin [Acidiferrimicrobium sp. IK]|uniref:ferredoxin n=1 Tax=Acidiferrimicrobium sp. IK TaxID=2871700 RepID=UPI0021CB3026|nr:ferredoxin [Acidiferrimicrobium sp. IK]MCU4183463.1 ferredoxin [Acidiferrimicrobium sp. IK]
MRILIDAAACTGHGRCYSLAPELFEDDEQGHGRVVGDGSVPPELQAAAQRAETACPERAVSLLPAG